METLLDLFDEAVARFADRPAVALRTDDGSLEVWTYRELDRRSRLAAWRLRALGLEPGDRVLTWSPSSPALPATYLGAIRARLVIVPLDLRMTPATIARIAERSGARHLIVGSGRDAPDPMAAGLDAMPTTTVDVLAADVDAASSRAGAAGEAAIVAVPADWAAQLEGWPAPTSDEVFDLIFTSGTTGAPKGVMLAHDNVLAAIGSFGRIIPPLHHRIVSLLPLSHLLEQAVGLFYALSVGAEIRYVRSRNPRVVFEAIREHRVTSMVVVPQVLDLFWSAIEHEIERSGRATTFARLRRFGRRLPMGARRVLFRSVHARLGGGLRLFVSSGAFLPPALQQAWEDLGVVVLQGYGSTETGSGTCTTLDDHGLGTVGRVAPPLELRLAPDGEVLFRGPTLFKGYWQDPEATAAVVDAEGWYHTGDIGHLDAGGRLILSGRKKDIIVLPNGFNVYPEDVENALRVAGIRESVVVETAPGRIEAIVLAGGPFAAGPPPEPEAIRAATAAAVRAANEVLSAQQRISGWRFWPDDDFPRTHTLKIRRDEVRRWAEAEPSLPVREDGRAGGQA